MAANPQPRLTPEQYLEIERAADFRSEYYQGSMYAMSGGSVPHGTIIGNTVHEVKKALEGRRCLVVPNDLRVQVAPDGLYTYPNVVVVCGEMKIADDHNDMVLNPTVIFEVLSASTEPWDRGFKFSQYRMIESLKEYVLISQWEHRVEVFHRQENGDWLLSEACGLDGICSLRALNCTIPLAGIYSEVTLAPRPRPTPETRR